MWNYVYFHVFIVIYSLSSTTTVQWTLLHSLLGLQHLQSRECSGFNTYS